MNRQTSIAAKAAQCGISLIFALLTLAALSLAAVALVRSVNTASLVVGNLGFKQDSMFFAGQAAEEAIAWIDSNKVGIKLDGVDGSQGYYPIAFENLDPTNQRPAELTRAVVDWDGNNCATPYTAGTWATCLQSNLMAAVSPTGNSARYVITRLCTTAASSTDVANSCAKPIVGAAIGCGSQGALQYPPPAGCSVDPGPYYRVVVRALGARNSLSYSETIVHF